jgi:hypothetical protein
MPCAGPVENKSSRGGAAVLLLSRIPAIQIKVFVIGLMRIKSIMTSICTPADEVPNIERWRSVKNSMVSNQRALFVSNGSSMKQHTLQKINRDKNDDIDQAQLKQ